jgi:hypothetical protein
VWKKKPRWLTNFKRALKRVLTEIKEVARANYCALAAMRKKGLEEKD